MKSEVLEKSIIKEVDHRWILPLTIGSIQNIKNSGIVPLVVAEQLSINKKGGSYIKQRMTRDCSFPGISGISVNNRLQRE